MTKEGYITLEVSPEMAEVLKGIADAIRKEEAGAVAMPCPFCGSVRAPTVMLRSELTGEATHGEFAVCCRCQADGCGAVGGFRGSTQDAIAAWNARDATLTQAKPWWMHSKGGMLDF